LKAHATTATLAQDAVAPSVARQRIESIDVVRGIIMILMALDHTREFFGVVSVSPTDIALLISARTHLHNRPDGDTRCRSYI
jgi:uncharacterized membrane protein